MQPSSAAAVEWLIAERNALRIISQFKDDEDEYLPHRQEPRKGSLPSALPVGFGLNLFQLSAACAVSPNRHWLSSRRQIWERARDRLAQLTIIMALSVQNFMATSV
jgi:hypothetical protein